MKLLTKLEEWAYALGGVLFPIAVVFAVLFGSWIILGPSMAGAVFGIVLGQFVIGGLLGWGLSALRVPYPWADVLGLLIVVVISGFTNSNPAQPITTTWMMYGLGAIPAFLLLRAYHRARPKRAKPNG